MQDILVQLQDGNPLGISAKRDICPNKECTYNQYGMLPINGIHCTRNNVLFIRHARFDKNGLKYGYGKWICGIKALHEFKQFFASSEIQWVQHEIYQEGV